LFTFEWTTKLKSKSYVFLSHQFPHTSTPAIRQYDTKNRKSFLKRILYPDIEVGDLFIGAKLNM